MWITFLASNWRLFAIGGAVLAVLTYIGVLKVEVHHKESQRVAAVNELGAYRAQAEAELAKAVAAKKLVEDQFATNLKETTNAYQNKLASLNARYERLRNETAGVGNAVPGDPVSQGSSVDAARVEELPRCVAEDRRAELIELLEDADRTREKLTACQEWVRKLEQR